MQRRRLLTGIGLLLILFVAALCRLCEFNRRFVDDQPLFYGPDSYYHARRILHATQHYPNLITNDYGLQFPNRFLTPWPPLYDVTLATLLQPLRITDTNLEQALAYSPLFIAMATLLLFFFWLRRLTEDNTALFGALLFALFPPHIDGTMVGSIDHHSIEPLALLCMLWIGTHKKMTSATATPWLFWSGWGLGLLLGFSQVVFVYLGLYVVALLLTSNNRRLWLHFTGLSCGMFCIALWEIIHGYPVIGYQSVSLLQPLLLLSAGLVALAKNSLDHNRSRALAVILAVVGILLLVRHGLGGGLGFLAANPVIALIAESRPLWRVDTLWLGYCGYFFFVYPVFIGYAWLHRKHPIHRALTPFLLAIAAGCWLLALLQLRFAIALAPLVATIAAMYGMHWLTSRRGKRRLQPAFAVLIAVAAIFCNYAPIVRGMLADLPYGPSANKLDFYELTQWLRHYTDPAGDAEDPEAQATYGVMAGWSMGHEILQLGKRAVVANPYIFDRNTPGLRDSLSWFYLWSEAEIYDYTRTHRIRYSVVHPLLSDTAANLAVLEVPVTEFLTAHDGRFHLTRRFKQSALYTQGFSVDDQLRGGAHARLVYESKPRASELGGVDSRYKIYEQVAGAIVSGKGRGKRSQRVRVELALKGHNGRPLQAFWETTTDAQGNFQLTLPYATLDTRATVRGVSPEGSYRLFLDGARKTQRFDLRETDVIEGKVVRLQ